MRVLSLAAGTVPTPPPAPAEGRASSTTDVRWVGVGSGPASRLVTLFGPSPDVVLAEPRSAAAAGWLAAWHRAALLVDAREAVVTGRASAPLRRAARVIAGDGVQRAALEAAGVEAGRILEIVPGSPAADPARGSITRVASLSDALRETFRISRGRGIPPRPAGAYRVMKRTLDFVVGFTLLLLLAPLLLLVALIIRWESPGPALFRQRRIGRGTSEFTILKFRTMAVGTPDLASHLMGPGSKRVTRVGRVLRRTSIDELPQLWHLVTGDMSLVGPRPALHNQYDLIALRQAAGVDALKPGVTGWAQVNGRDEIPLEQKVGFDRHYLEHVSVAHDFMILARTAMILFSDRGTF